jgi:hypothetical protein
MILFNHTESTIKVFKYRPPYKKDGKTNFPETKDKTGVYIIKKNNKIIYVGVAMSSLYKTLYRHFQVWNPSSKEISEAREMQVPPPKHLSYVNDLKKNNFTVRVIYASKSKAAALEKALIQKYLPTDNDIVYKPKKRTQSYYAEKYQDKVFEEYNGTTPLPDIPF